MDEKKKGGIRIKSNRNSGSSGIGISGVLTIVFIVLKLVGVINWSWLWVLCPLWINCLLTIIILVVIVIIDKKTANKTWKSRRIK